MAVASASEIDERTAVAGLAAIRDELAVAVNAVEQAGQALGAAQFGYELAQARDAFSRALHHLPPVRVQVV
jgi:hypothetical protein